jgi:WD40 repeat protein
LKGKLITKFDINCNSKAIKQLDDGNICIGNDNSQIYIYSLKGKLKKKIDLNDGTIYSIDQLKNKKIIVPTSNGNVHIYKKNGDFVKKINISSNIWSCCALKDGRFCLGDSQGMVYLCDKNGKVKKKFEGHNKNIRYLIQLKNGRILSTSEDNTMIIWK